MPSRMRSMNKAGLFWMRQQLGVIQMVRRGQGVNKMFPKSTTGTNRNSGSWRAATSQRGVVWIQLANNILWRSEGGSLTSKVYRTWTGKISYGSAIRPTRVKQVPMQQVGTRKRWASNACSGPPVRLGELKTGALHNRSKVPNIPLFPWQCHGWWGYDMYGRSKMVKAKKVKWRNMMRKPNLVRLEGKIPKVIVNPNENWKMEEVGKYDNWLN